MIIIMSNHECIIMNGIMIGPHNKKPRTTFF